MSQPSAPAQRVPGMGVLCSSKANWLLIEIRTAAIFRAVSNRDWGL